MTKRKAFAACGSFIVIAVAVILTLVLTGVIGGGNGGIPATANAMASASNTEVVKNLSTDAYFDIAVSTNPSSSLSNYVVIKDNKGDSVALRSENLGGGTYRITAQNGFKARQSYQIWLRSGAEFVFEDYAGLSTFIFMTAGEEVEKVTIKDSVITISVAEVESVEKIAVGDDVFYTITLKSAADNRYATGQIIITKKSEDSILNNALSIDYGAEDTDEFADMAAYKVVRTSEVVGGKEELYVQSAEITDVIDELDIYKIPEFNQDNVTINEDVLQQAAQNGAFATSLQEAAAEALSLVSLPAFTIPVSDSPKQAITIEVGWEDDLIQLDFYYTIALGAGLNLIFGAKNDIALSPVANFKLDGYDLTMDLGLTMDIVTSFSITLEASPLNKYSSNVDNFIDKMKEILNSKDTALFDTEIPVFTYKYPVYCFVFGVELGLDLQFGLKGKLAVEYVEQSTIVAGVTYVNDEFAKYSSFDTDGEATSFVLTGKARAEAGPYIKLTASVLEVVGVGFKVGVGVYAEMSGQVNLDIEEARKGNLNLVTGYYIESGLYLDMAVQVTLDIKIKEWVKEFEIKRWEVPFFEFGSKYLPVSYVNAGGNIEVYGNYVIFDSVQVNAYEICNISGTKKVAMDIDNFVVAYKGSAANYIEIKDGKIYVKPNVLTEFTAEINLTYKNDKSLTTNMYVHKAAVAPSCADTSMTFDKKSPSDVTFDVALNASKFITLSGNDVTGCYSYINGKLTIDSNYLNGKSIGNYTFVFESNKGNIYLTVEVTDTTPITAAVASKTFLKSSGANVSYSLALNGAKVEYVAGLNAGEYSCDSSGTLVLFARKLMTLAVGSYNYTVNASNGSEVALTLNVVDDRIPVIYTTSYDFSKTSTTAKDVVVEINLYGNTFRDITGNDISSSDYSFNAAASTLTIKASYLTVLDLGEYGFTVTTLYGTEINNIDISINIKENLAIVLSNRYGEFDLNAPKAVTFTLYTSSSTGVTVSGNGIKAADYTYAANVLTIGADYLSTLPVGEYKFTVGANIPDLTVKVVNSELPAITAVGSGSYTIHYDKANSGEKRFEIDLGSATLSKLDGNGIAASDYNSAFSENGIMITISAAYLDNLSYGTYEFALITSVNSISVTIVVNDTREPKALNDSNINYDQANGGDLDMTFENYGYNVTNIIGENIRGEYYRFDVTTGKLVICAEFMFTLPANDHTYFNVYFNDSAKTNVRITVAVRAGEFAAKSIGAGTVANPYMLYTKAQFVNFVKDAASYAASECYKLGADIDIASSTIETAASFAGVLDGDGYTVSNFTIKSEAEGNLGLFGTLTGTVRNIKFVNATATFSGSGVLNMGIVAGINNGTIANVSIYCLTIKAEHNSWFGYQADNAYFYVGGIAGKTTGNITDCTVNSADINVNSRGIIFTTQKSLVCVGAIVGYIETGAVSGCSANGRITANTTNNKNESVVGLYGENANPALNPVDNSTWKGTIVTK